MVYIDTARQIEENDQTALACHPENQPESEPTFAPDFDGLWTEIQAEFDQMEDLHLHAN